MCLSFLPYSNLFLPLILSLRNSVLKFSEFGIVALPLFKVFGDEALKLLEVLLEPLFYEALATITQKKGV